MLKRRGNNILKCFRGMIRRVLVYIGHFITMYIGEITGVGINYGRIWCSKRRWFVVGIEK